MTPALQRLRLREYGTVRVYRQALTSEAIEVLRANYASQVGITLDPFGQDGDAWVLTSQGYVGYIPVTRDLHLELAPKVPLGNLFGMLEYAYRLGEFGQGQIACQTLQEVYERLAGLLAKRVLARARQGLYCEYVGHQDRSAVVRGRIDTASLARAPWRVQVDCRYQEHTADMLDNQILTWTLYAVARSGICTERVLPSVRRAYRQMAHSTSLVQPSAQDCLQCLYHRLNQDYQPLHALCHFFLANSGPTHRSGDHTMTPFWVNMASLFETFVAEWLRQHAPAAWRIDPQYKVDLGEQGALHFRIDLVVRDRESGLPLVVLDTKYKTEEKQADVHQIIAYCHTLGCKRGALIYPAPLAVPLDVPVQDITLRSLTFDLANRDLEVAGQAFLRDLQALLT